MTPPNAIGTRGLLVVRIVHKFGAHPPLLLANTLLERGVGAGERGSNRFSEFPQYVETVETVLRPRPAQITSLKQGVNSKSGQANQAGCEIFGERDGSLASSN
jgi:hypothetical protein